MVSYGYAYSFVFSCGMVTSRMIGLLSFIIWAKYDCSPSVSMFFLEHYINEYWLLSMFTNGIFRFSNCDYITHPVLIWQLVQEGIKTLIVHLVEKYSSKLESIDYVDTFRALKLKYEQVSIYFQGYGNALGLRLK